MPVETRRGARFLGTGIIDSHMLPSVFWDLKLGPLEEQGS